jgi:hypothetical protein
MRSRFGSNRICGWLSLLQLTMVLFAAAASLALAHAQIADKGELLFQDDFRSYSIFTQERQPAKAKGWQIRVAHAEWRKTAEGIESVWTSGHNPVLVFEGTFGDVVIEVDFRYKYEPGKWASCRVCASNSALEPRAYCVSVWANPDNKARARGLVLENDEWSGLITRVGYGKADFQPDTWYTLRVEIVGNETAAFCNATSVRGKYEKFGLPKTALWLGTGQSPHELRNLRVYAARPTSAGNALPRNSANKPEAK